MNGRRLFVALIVAIALVMAACGSSSKSVGPPPAGSTTTPTPVVSKALGTGVTATSIKLGISLVDFKCIQQFIDFTRPNQQAVYQAFIDDVNKKGGINGRKIVADFNTECPLTPTSDLLVQVCTKFTDDDKVFAVMGNLADAAQSAFVSGMHVAALVAAAVAVAGSLLALAVIPARERPRALATPRPEPVPA